VETEKPPLQAAVEPKPVSGFFAEHDLIDQLRGLTVSRRLPRNIDTCEVAPQSLDKRHKIPNRKDVRLHEDPQRPDIADRCKHGMLGHALPDEFYIASVVENNSAHFGLSSYL